jgi:hypothetical protein
MATSEGCAARSLVPYGWRNRPPRDYCSKAPWPTTEYTFHLLSQILQTIEPPKSVRAHPQAQLPGQRYIRVSSAALVRSQIVLYENHPRTPIHNPWLHQFVTHHLFSHFRLLLSHAIWRCYYSRWWCCCCGFSLSLHNFPLHRGMFRGLHLGLERVCL